MGDDERGPAGEQRVERLLHEHLVRPVERAGSFIEDYNRRVLAEDTGQSNSLPLTLAEWMTAFSDNRFVLLRQIEGHLVDERSARRGRDLSHRGVRRAIADVVGQSTAENDGFLWHDAQMLP